MPPVISVVLKLADCNVRVNHNDLALQYYKMARTLSAQTGELKLESFADVAEAALQAKIGQPYRALPLYQSALQIDSGLGDQHSEAVDWFLYAMFLRERGSPARLVYASLLKSRLLLESSGDPKDDPKYDRKNDRKKETPEAARVRSELERQLGAQAVSINRNLDPALQEALQLKR